MPMLAIEVLKELERWYRESNGAFAPKGTAMYDDERTWHDVVEEALLDAGEPESDTASRMQFRWLIEAENPTRYFWKDGEHGIEHFTCDAWRAMWFKTKLGAESEIARRHFPFSVKAVQHGFDLASRQVAEIV